MTKYDYTIPDHKIEYGVELPLSSLTVDRSVQRGLNKNRAHKISDDLIKSALGCLQVSLRKDGKHYVIDGQHRLAAMVEHGLKKWWCIIHHGLTKKQEAQLFLVLNQESVRPGSYDEYIIGLAGEVDVFVDCDKVLKSHGLEVGKATSANKIGAVAVVRDVVRDFGGPDVLDRVITTSESAFGREGGAAWDGPTLAGLGIFYDKWANDPTVNTGKLAGKLQRKGLIWLQGRTNAIDTLEGTRGTGSGGRKYAAYKAIVEVWNHRNPNKIVLKD